MLIDTVVVSDIRSNTNIYLCLRYYDLYIDAMVIPKKYDLNKIVNFNIIFNYSEQCIPLYLLIKISPVKISKEYYIISLPKYIYSKYKCKDLYEPHLKYHLEYCHNGTQLPLKYQIIINRRDNRNKINYLKAHIINNYNVHQIHRRNNMWLSCNMNVVKGIFIQTNKKLCSIELLFDRNYAINYDRLLVKYMLQRVYKYKWTYDKKNALFTQLTKFMPIDVINIINNYVKTHVEYIYWLPFIIQTKWNDNNEKTYMTVQSDTSHDINIKFNDEYSGNIYVVGISNNDTY